MIRMLMLSNMYPSERSPGYGPFVRTFEKSMVANGAAIEKVVIRVQHTTAWQKAISYWIYLLSAWFKLAVGRHDIIYVHYAAHSLLPVTFVRWLIRKPLVINVHGSDLLPKSRLGKWLLRINRNTIANANLIVAPSDYYRDVVQEMFAHDDIVVSPSSGIDLARFKTSEEARESPNDCLRIGFVSRLISGKGWRTLLSALGAWRQEDPSKPFHLDLVGGGEDFDHCRALVEELGLGDQVIMHGGVSHDALPAFFQSFDVFVFPSERRSESLGLVGLEAMACGCPVIGSDMPGILSYLEDGVNGRVFSHGDSSALKQALVDFREMTRIQRSSLSQRALETAQRYEQDFVGKSLYEEINRRFSPRD